MLFKGRVPVCETAYRHDEPVDAHSTLRSSRIRSRSSTSLSTFFSVFGTLAFSLFYGKAVKAAVLVQLHRVLICGCRAVSGVVVFAGDGRLFRCSDVMSRLLWDVSCELVRGGVDAFRGLAVSRIFSVAVVTFCKLLRSHFRGFRLMDYFHFGF